MLGGQVAYWVGGKAMCVCVFESGEARREDHEWPC